MKFHSLFAPKQKPQPLRNRITGKRVERLEVIPCCEALKYYREEHVIYYSEEQNKFNIDTNWPGLDLLFIEINFCPWCGASLNPRVELPDLREITQ